jgi:hypothetical protein
LLEGFAIFSCLKIFFEARDSERGERERRREEKKRRGRRYMYLSLMGGL